MRVEVVSIVMSCCSTTVPEMPSSIMIITITNTTITVAWTSPNVTNGILGDYIISYMGYKENNDVSVKTVSECMDVLCTLN